MNLLCASDEIEDYQVETTELNYSHPLIKEKITELFHPAQTEIEKATAAFEFVRDEIFIPGIFRGAV